MQMKTIKKIRQNIIKENFYEGYGAKEDTFLISFGRMGAEYKVSDLFSLFTWGETPTITGIKIRNVRRIIKEADDRKECGDLPGGSWKDLEDDIKNYIPRGYEFRPTPFYNRFGDQIELVWEDEMPISEYINDKFDIHRSMETNEIVGVTIKNIMSRWGDLIRCE